MAVNNHLQKSLDELKSTLTDMADLVRMQLESISVIMADGPGTHIEMINHREKRINEQELIIDSDCEKILALYGPVAIDLRLVLSVIEMNTHFERLGDLAQSAAHSVEDLNVDQLKKVLEKTNMKDHVLGVISGIDLCMDSFNEENISLTGDVFHINKKIKKEVSRYRQMLIELVQKDPKQAELALSFNQVCRLVKRMCDMVDNIAEEVVFYIEAKVLKHKKKKSKMIRKHLMQKDDSVSDTEE